MQYPGKGRYERPKFGTKDADVLRINAPALRAIRQKRGLSRRELAEKIGASVENIARIEKGQGGTYRITANKLAEVLQTKVHYFIDRT